MKRGKNIMTYEATSIKRFSVIFAIWCKNSWRIRFHVVVSPKGVIVFRLSKTIFMENGRIFMPEEIIHHLCVSLFIGVHSNDNEIDLTVRAYANATGTDTSNPTVNNEQ